jgi:hypothetical protein
MTVKICASDKQRAALAARLASPVAKTATAPPPEPTGSKMDPVAKKKKPEKPKSELNEFEIAGRARRAARQNRMHRMAIVRERLIALFPKCFKPPGEKMLPLKIGIDKDIFAALPEFSHKDVSLTLSYYVGNRDYYRELVEGAMRVDLNGIPTTAVTSSEARQHEKPREGT